MIFNSFLFYFYTQVVHKNSDRKGLRHWFGDKTLFTASLRLLSENEYAI